MRAFSLDDGQGQESVMGLGGRLAVYDWYVRRDNKYKARIKILVKALTPEVFD